MSTQSYPTKMDIETGNSQEPSGLQPVVLVLTKKFSQWLRSPSISWSLKDKDGNALDIQEPYNWPTDGSLTKESAEQTARQYCEENHLLITETKEEQKYD